VLTLPARTVRLCGFTDEEALIPFPKTVYPGYRLLQEYFTLPQKFAFFEVTGLEALPADRLGDRFAILLSFKDGLPTGTRVQKDNLRLFCTPVVNLFTHTADPLKPDLTKYEYLARPSGGQPEAYEIYSVDKVTDSPLKIAPPFRTLHLRYPVESLEEALGEGIVTGHPSMPEFRLDPGQVGDVISYLKSLER